MLGATSSGGNKAGGIWNQLGKKDTQQNANAKALDADLQNLTSVPSAGMRGNGPAVQRIVVVGHCMSGKRALIDRLRRAAEPPQQESKHFHGKFGAARAKAANAEEKRAEAVTGPTAKTVTPTVRGCGSQFTSVAYHYNDLEVASLVDQASTFDFNDARAAKIASLIGDSNAPTKPAGPGASNTVAEIISCDVAEALDSALPSYEVLQYTAIVIVLDAMDISDGAALIAYWANAVNARVRLLTYQFQNHKSGDNKAFSSTGGKQGVSKSQGSAIAPPDLSGIDVRVLSEKRREELAIATLAASGEAKARFIDAYPGGAASTSDMPPIPDSLRLLLPSLVLLSKIDLLEEACKVNTNNANEQVRNFGVAIQHARWLAFQRGSAFAAASTRSPSAAYFQALWTYITYSLLPGQFELSEYLKSQRAATTEEQEEESRREVAAFDARRRRKLERKGQRAEGEDSGNEAHEAETNEREDGEDRDYRRRLQQEVLAVATLADPTVKEFTTAAPGQHVFIPKGLEDPSLIEKQTASVPFVRTIFAGFATSVASEALKEANIASPTLREPSAGGSPSAQYTEPESAIEVTRKMFDTFSKSMQTELNNAPKADYNRPAAMDAARAGSSSPTANIPDVGATDEGKDEEMIWDQ